MLVKDVLLHDLITKEALYVLRRTRLYVQIHLSLCELLEAKSAFEVLLLDLHLLADLAVKQVFLHQFFRVGFKAVATSNLLMAVCLLVVHQLVRT